MTDRAESIVVPESASIRAAMEAIDRGAVDIALAIDSDKRLVGTITDGDIRRAILRGCSLSEPASTCMTRRFVAVGVDTTRAEVLDLMRARFLEQIPILDEAGRLVGLHLLREMLGAVPRPNWAVVMAGGRGERLRPITDAIPKPMIKVAGRPILERIVLHLVGFGIRRIFLSVYYKADLIQRHFGDGSNFGSTIEYLLEPTPLGTGGGLSLLPSRPDHPLFVLNGDLVTQIDVAQMLRAHCEGGHAATVAVHQYVHTVPFGVFDVKDGRVSAFREKPTQCWQANAGVYVLAPSLVQRVPQKTSYSLPEVIEECLQRGESVGAFNIEDEWIDVGQPQELHRAKGEVRPL